MQSRKDFKLLLGILQYPILLYLLLAIATPQIDCSLAMKRLYEDLFSDYNRLILPVANNRSKVTVTLGLKLGQILDLNLKQQILSTNVWVEQSWFDYKLTWNPQKYQGIDMIHVPAENIWIPDIVLFNNADGNYELTMMTKAKVFYNGSVVWRPPTMYRSTCEIDVEYFPFDVQICLLRFGSWTYAGDEVELKHVDLKDRKVDIGIDLTEFHKNVEWDIIEVPASYNEEYYDCCTEAYPDITFKIVIRRKILFYMVNLLLPTAVMAFMTVFVFYLPSKSDEKVTLSISILISLIVFFLLMLEIIPASSLAVPLFGKYLLSTLMLVFTSTCVTVFVLNIYYRSPSVHTMSPWTRKIFLETLPGWLGMKRPDVKERNSLTRFRKKRARKLFNSNNRIYDSSTMTNDNNIQQHQQPFNISKLSDLLEETEDEDEAGEDEGRYFRRHIDRYRHRCRLHATTTTSTSINDNNDESLGKKSLGRNSRTLKQSNISTSNLRHRSNPSMFTSLDSNTELKTLSMCRCGSNLDNSIGFKQQQQQNDNNNSLIRNKNQHNNCTVAPVATVRHPLDACMPNEDTLDMTFDYDDELPTPPPPPPQRPGSKLSINNDNNHHHLLTTAPSLSRSGYIDGNNHHHQKQIDSLDLSSSEQDSQIHENNRIPQLNGRLSSYMQHNVDSSVNGEDDDSNNVKSESIQSSIMNQMIHGSTLDAGLLLENSSIDNNNDSGQTILTRQPDSCTCCDYPAAVAAAAISSARYRGFGGGGGDDLQRQTSSSLHKSPHYTTNHQGSRTMHYNNQNISSNYSSSTAATIPPPPPTLQSTLPSRHHHHQSSDHAASDINVNQYYSAATTGRKENNSNNDENLAYRSDNLTNCCATNTITNERGDGGKSLSSSGVAQMIGANLSSSALMSLKVPYNQMPAHVQAAIRSILFIADTIKNEDVENRAVEDWNFMSMVIDRLFLWIFLVLCFLGSFMLLMFAPSLYDNRPSIDDILRVDIPISNCSAEEHGPKPPAHG